MLVSQEVSDVAFYLVKAEVTGKLEELKRKLDAGEIRTMRPFGTSLDYSLREARVLADGTLTWEEEDYCRPPLAQERAAVLDHYFRDVQVKRVNEGEGWKEIEHLPRLWSGAARRRA